MSPITDNQKQTLNNKADNLRLFKSLDQVDWPNLEKWINWLKQVNDKEIASDLLDAWASADMPNNPNHSCNLNNLNVFLRVCKQYQLIQLLT